MPLNVLPSALRFGMQALPADIGRLSSTGKNPAQIGLGDELELAYRESGLADAVRKLNGPIKSR